MTLVTKGFAQVNGGKIFYEVAGEGDAILFIHGLFLDSRLWDAQFHALAKTNKVIRFDLRGFGHSEITEESFANYDDIKALLEFLDVRKTHVVGLSLGALIALELAIVYPELVERLVLCSMKLSRNESSALQTSRQEFWTALQSGDISACIDLSEKMWLIGPDGLGHADKVTSALYREMSEDNFTKPRIKSKPIFLEEIDKKLEEIKVKTLIVNGELDFDDYIVAATELQQNIKDSKIVRFENAAHIVNVSQPELFNDTLKEFFSNAL